MEVQIINYNDPNAAQKFFDSLKGTGFAVIDNHPISNQLIDDVYADWKTFFESSDENKRQYLFKRDYEKFQDGFFPMEVAEKAKGENVLDIKEFYHYYPAGRKPQGLSDKTEQLHASLLKMSDTLLGWVEDSLPEAVRAKLKMPLRDMADHDLQTVLRILHYPPLPENIEPGALRAAAHEDINLITMLPAATEAGLEVLDLKGVWHAVPYMPHAIIVNTGDMLQEATLNDDTGEFYLTATKHRVINPTGEEATKSRYSLPLFLHAKNEAVLSSRHTGHSYRRERFAELGLI